MAQHPEFRTMQAPDLRLFVREAGENVMTLKDQSILADGDINKEADMLDNIEIGEQKQRDEAYKAAEKKGTYDDKFNDDPSSKKSILSHYDDTMGDEAVTLDEGGRFTGEAEKKLEEITPKEAFRHLSHKFHGKERRKLKLVKQQKKFQDELKAKRMKSSDTPLMFAEKMREAQTRCQTPYLVLNGNAETRMAAPARNRSGHPTEN